ncbi:MAG: hypothetical protein AAFQ22_00535 [Pseudomonadota bacterium]
MNALPKLVRKPIEITFIDGFYLLKLSQDETLALSRYAAFGTLENLRASIIEGEHNVAQISCLNK